MPKETPKIAGTMMKTRSRVKRTVMEIPKRLTTRLSKGSRRNMVKGPGKAGALQPDRRAACSNEPVLLLLSKSHTCTESAACSETPFQSSHPFGALRERMQQDQGEHLGKQANSLPGAQVSSDGAAQRAQRRWCTHTGLSMGVWWARQQHDCRNRSLPRLPLSKSCRGAACGESGSRIPSWLLRACRVSSEGQGGVHP